jgi:hypothetical protein
MQVIQDAQALIEGQLQANKSFNVPPIAESIKKMGYFKIFNINTFHPHWVQELGTLGTYLIPQAEEGFVWEPRKPAKGENAQDVAASGDYERRPAKPGEMSYSRPCKVAKIVNEGNAVDIRKISFTQWDGRLVAADVLGIGPFKNANQDLTLWGCFLAEGDVPTKEELEEAHAKLTKKAEELWKQGQAYHMQGPNHAVDITEYHRWANDFLGRDAEWCNESKRTIECPGCGERVWAEAAAHTGGKNPCGTIINEEKAAKLEAQRQRVLAKK